MMNYMNTTESDLATLYKVMMKRITKNLKADQLSFLIGMPDNFIENVEALKVPCYTETDLKRIAATLEDTDYQSFFAVTNYSNEVRASMETHIHDLKLFHVCCTYTTNHKRHSSFTLYEDAYLSPELVKDELSDYQISIARDTLSLMLRNGYFSEERCPYEIYHYINNSLCIRVNPYVLRAALNRLCLDDVAGALRKCYLENEYVYVEKTLIF